MTKLKQRLYRGGVAAAVLAVAAVPLSAGAATTDTIINADVDSTISISSTTPVNISLLPSGSAVVSSASDTVSVSTNSSNGYKLTLANADATSNLVSGANNITPVSGTPAAPEVLANGTWGFAVGGLAGFQGSYSAETNSTSSTTTWAAVPTSGSPYEIRDHGSTASNHQTTVWYGVRVDASQPNGTYTDTVTYSATASS